MGDFITAYMPRWLVRCLVPLLYMPSGALLLLAIAINGTRNPWLEAVGLVSFAGVMVTFGGGVALTIEALSGGWGYVSERSRARREGRMRRREERRNRWQERAERRRLGVELKYVCDQCHAIVPRKQLIAVLDADGVRRLAFCPWCRMSDSTPRRETHQEAMRRQRLDATQKVQKTWQLGGVRTVQKEQQAHDRAEAMLAECDEIDAFIAKIEGELHPAEAPSERAAHALKLRRAALSGAILMSQVRNAVAFLSEEEVAQFDRGAQWQDGMERHLAPWPEDAIYAVNAMDKGVVGWIAPDRADFKGVAKGAGRTPDRPGEKPPPSSPRIIRKG